MFTGIIECLGTVVAVAEENGNRTFIIESSITEDLKEDQSVAHDGVCLTVTGFRPEGYVVTAIAETLRKTTLGSWKPGDQVNLERCVPVDGRFDGHIVQGHVDLTATCEKVTEEDGSWLFQFRYDASSGHLTVAKGSIAINGVSLTVVESSPGYFSVAIIPYTWEHTTFKNLFAGKTVNLEFDILGKYVKAWMERR
ncbi:MAG: riboflavin synthase [Sphingobacteriales bacterium]|jgi:riboflavin synthase|nr:riboflavin synthase [Sphingobacteriales bacterium]